MDTINALHDKFKEATSKLQRSQDRVTRLESELRQYHMCLKNLTEEEDDVEKSITYFKKLLNQEQEELENHEVAYQKKLLELELIMHKTELYPALVCNQINVVNAKQNSEIVCLAKNLELTSAKPNMNRYFSVDITQARRTLKLAKEANEKACQSKMYNMQHALKEETSTLHLLQACIDGMIRKNQEIRDSSNQGVSCSSLPPKNNEQGYHCPVALDNPHTLQHQQPLFQPDSELYQWTSAPQPLSTHTTGVSKIDMELNNCNKEYVSEKPYQAQQSLYQPPWYMFNRKKQKVIASTTSRSHVVTSKHSTYKGDVVTTKETFHSGSELLQLQKEHIIELEQQSTQPAQQACEKGDNVVCCWNIEVEARQEEEHVETSHK